MSEFWATAEEIKRLWAWIVAAAGLPFLAGLAKVAPPWPPAVPVLTSIVNLLALIVSYQFFQVSSKKLINKVIIINLVILIIFSMLYLGFLSEMTFEVPGSNVDRIKGFSCTDLARVSFPGKCPWFGESELRLAEWTPENLWNSWSITAVRLAIVALWLVSFMSFSTILGTFVIFQRGRHNKA